MYTAATMASAMKRIPRESPTAKPIVRLLFEEPPETGVTVDETPVLTFCDSQ